MQVRAMGLVAVLVLAMAPYTEGRIWQARNDDRQVDAEFVKLRGDHVILKRADTGKLIEVPLETLSEKDVQYVEARTKGSGDELPFRYGFKPGVSYRYAYRLSARLTSGSSKGSFLIFGGVGYTALPAESDDTDAPRLNLDYSSSLYLKGTGIFKTGDISKMSHIAKTDHGSLVVNTRGEYISGKFNVSVPFMFVPLSQMPLDPMVDYEPSWVHEDTIQLVTEKVQESGGDSPFGPFPVPRPPRISDPFQKSGPGRRPSPPQILSPFARPSQPTTSLESEEAATERCEYRWGDVTDEHRLLHRHYELKTADGGYEVNYDSVVTFDREDRIPLHMEGEGTIQHSSENVTIKIPVKFAYRLTEADAWRASKNLRLIPDLFEIPDEAKSLEYLETMRGGSADKRRDLMYYIKGVQPGAYRAEIAAEIAKALGSDDFWQRYAAAQAIRPWATEKEAPAILDAVKKGGEGEYYDWVLIAAGRFPSAEAAEAVAGRLPAHRQAATAALIEMGPVAEDAAIKLTESSDHNVRAHVAVILGIIGTEKSLPFLSKMKSDSYAHAKECAEKAYRYIQARQGGV